LFVVVKGHLRAIHSLLLKIRHLFHDMSRVTASPIPLVLVVWVIVHASAPQAMAFVLHPPSIQVPHAFHQPSVVFQSPKVVTSTQLFMASGSGRLNNKQAALKQKMELAKQQKLRDTANEPQDSVVLLSDDEIRQRNDRLRFEELLQTQRGGVFVDEYRSPKQEEEEIEFICKYVEL
jgi:hypothetical protein